MNNPVSKFFMAAVFVYVLTVSAAWAERVLIDDPAQTVSVGNNFSCYAPVNVTVDTSRPELYEQANQLQNLTDGVRAMLSYECPQLSSIKVTGLIRGLNEVVYQGQASKTDNWQVKQIAVIDSHQSNTLDSEIKDSEDRIWSSKRYDDELSPGQLAVTGIRLGMSLDEVTQIIIDRFSIEPSYEAGSGEMLMNDGESLADVEVNSKCIKAWFSDHRVSRLEQLELTQIEGNIEQVNNLLIDKFGNPTELSNNKTGDESNAVWHAINDTESHATIEEIDAVVSAHDNNRVSTKITLYSLDQITMPTNQDYANIDLTL